MGANGDRSGFLVLTTFEGDAVTLRCAGELDMATADVLRGATGDLACDTVVDFRGVSFCDSSGLGVLIGLQQHLRGLGFTLRVTGVQPLVEKVFEATGLVAALGVEAANQVSELSPRRHIAMRHLTDDRRRPVGGRTRRR